MQWNSPDVGSAVLFTIGLVGWGAFPVVAAHAALGYPSGRVIGRADRIGVTTGYIVLAGLVGLAPALVFDPVDGSCRACPNNLLQLGSAPAVVEGLSRGGAVCAVVMSVALLVLCIMRVVRSSPAARRATGLVLTSAVVLLLGTTVLLVRSVVPATVPLDDATRQLVAVQGISLCALALGVVAGWVRLRRARSRMARYALDIGHAAPGGDLRGMLAVELRDPTLELAYPLDDGRLVDATGAPTTAGGPHRGTTALVRDGSTVAVLTHRAGLVRRPPAGRRRGVRRRVDTGQRAALRAGARAGRRTRRLPGAHHRGR
jgi:hypothetical protein